MSKLIKRCAPIQYGGCGLQKDISSFPEEGRGNHRPRCRQCHATWRKRTAEERERMKLPPAIYHPPRKTVEVIQVKTVKPAMHPFFRMPPTECEREYARVGNFQWGEL